MAAIADLMLPRRGGDEPAAPGATVAGVLHPVGSLHPRVYWTRRVVGCAVVLLIAVVPFLLLSGRGASEAASSGGPQPAQPPAATPQLELIPAQPLQTSTAAPTTTQPATTPPVASQPPVSTQPPPPAASQAPAVPCTDEMLAVTAGSQQPQYSVQDEPKLSMTVRNVSAQPCLRDVGTGQQEWAVFNGDVRLWGSNDCLFEPGADVQTLQPAQELTVNVEWSGLTSDPECAEPRTQLAPGDYQLRARIGSAQSPNAPLILR